VNGFSGGDFGPSSPSIDTVLVSTSKFSREIPLHYFGVKGLGYRFFGKQYFSECRGVQRRRLNTNNIISLQILVFFVSKVIISKSNIIEISIKS